VITAVMAVCIFYGIPGTPAPKRSGASPSFAGFLYLSAGCGLLFAALDQGQRLDWWRSGLFNGLFAGSALFLLCALVRRLRSPNPLVDLPYLRLWNTQVLAFCLILFRFWPAGYDHPHSAVPGDSWIRGVPVRTGGIMDGGAAAPYRGYCGIVAPSWF